MIEETIRALIESSYKNTYIGDCSIGIDDCNGSGLMRVDQMFTSISKLMTIRNIQFMLEHVITLTLKNELKKYIIY